MLKDVYVFDNSEPSNCEAFKNLPAFFQAFITDKHNDLRNVAINILEDTKFKPLFTSGFRSFSVNKKVGGTVQSLHLHGLAVDFVVMTKFGETIIDTKNVEKLVNDKFKLLKNKYAYTLITEKSHFHLQFNRKN